MLVSAPFDNWWHNAYGLDVKIVSPPMVLAAGMAAIIIGAMLMALAAQNQKVGTLDTPSRPRWSYAFTGGLVILAF